MKNPWVLFLNIRYWYQKRQCKKNLQHYPMGIKWTFDRLSRESVCRFCGKKILQESNGDWFNPAKIKY